MRIVATLGGLSLFALLAACGKVQEVASEKAVEKAIEASVEKGGGKAKVDLSDGTTKITTTDASGKTSQMEMGGAKISEADLGVPFYPGARPLEGQSSRVTTPDGSMLSIALHSDDPVDKVAGFYRDLLQAQASGKQFMNMSGGEGNYTLMLSDEQNKGYIQVYVNKGEKGSDIQIMANRGTGK